MSIFRFRFVRALSTACALLACVCAASAFAQQGDAASERQVKAAFLVRFVDYVQWPAGTFPAKDTPLVIGVVGDNGIAAELSSLVAGRTVQGRPLAVRVFKGEPINGVHMLFVTEPATGQLRQISRSVEGSVLIVSEAEDGLSRGSAINFVLVDRRVRFEVALNAANSRNLTLSSGLLSVALNVRKDSGLSLNVVAFNTTSGHAIRSKRASGLIF